MSEVCLETGRLVLRLPRIEDAAAAEEMFGDPEVMRFLGGEIVPPKDVPAVVQKWIDRWELNGVGSFLLERCENGRFVGRASSSGRRGRGRTAPSRKPASTRSPRSAGRSRGHTGGNGYATEAARAVRDWGRAKRGFDRLISLIAPDNVACQRVAARLGARPTETVLFDTHEAVVWMHA